MGCSDQNSESADVAAGTENLHDTETNDVQIRVSGNLGEWSLAIYDDGKERRVSGGTLEDFEFLTELLDVMNTVCTKTPDKPESYQDDHVQNFLALVKQNSQQNDFRIDYRYRHDSMVTTSGKDGRNHQWNERNILINASGDWWQCQQRQHSVSSITK